MDKWGIEAWQAWLGLGVLLGVAELFSLDLILIMLAVGAFAGMATAALDAPLWCRCWSRPRPPSACSRWCAPAWCTGCTPAPSCHEPRPAGRPAGHRDPGAELARPRPGALGGELWSAAPYDENLRIAAGETVEVLQIRGATAYVHPVARLEP